MHVKNSLLQKNDWQKNAIELIESDTKKVL